jgi:polyisoprenoid-binding protein YceI
MTETLLHPKYTVGTWALEPTHSDISFTVRHLAISKVRGKFETFDVTIVTAEDPKDSTIEATVDVSSVNTGQEARDGHLRTSDFFLVEEHPQMVFKATGAGLSFKGDDFTLVGDLTLRGITLPVTLTGELGGVIDDPYGNVRAGVTASTKINRHDFGVSWNQALDAGGFTLGDDVTINLELQFVLAK